MKFIIIYLLIIIIGLSIIYNVNKKNFDVYTLQTLFYNKLTPKRLVNQIVIGEFYPEKCQCDCSDRVFKIIKTC